MTVGRHTDPYLNPENVAATHNTDSCLPTVQPLRRKNPRCRQRMRMGNGTVGKVHATWTKCKQCDTLDEQPILGAGHTSSQEYGIETTVWRNYCIVETEVMDIRNNLWTLWLSAINYDTNVRNEVRTCTARGLVFFVTRHYGCTTIYLGQWNGHICDWNTVRPIRPVRPIPRRSLCIPWKECFRSIHIIT